jgi:hypothetical protein
VRPPLQGHAMPWASRAFKSLTAKFGIVVVTKAVGEFLIKRARHCRIVFLFSEARAPVECGRNFGGIGIERDLVFKTLRASGRSDPGGTPAMQPSNAHKRNGFLWESAPAIRGSSRWHGRSRASAGTYFQPRAALVPARDWLGRTAAIRLRALKDCVFVAGGTRGLAEQVKRSASASPCCAPMEVSICRASLLCAALFERAAKCRVALDPAFRKRTSATSSRYSCAASL